MNKITRVALCIAAVQVPKVGIEEGNRCNRDGCEGILGFAHPENCYCHLSPPCHHCTENPLTCPECGWEETA